MNKLTRLPVPDLSQIQLQAFTTQSILSEQAYDFDFNQTMVKLKNKIGTKILAFDIGATAIKAHIIKINSDLSFALEKDLGQQKNIDYGKGYVDFLLKKTQENPNLITGISTAGKIGKDGIPNAINFYNFVNEIKQKGGFSKILNTQKIVVQNDVVNLIIAGFFEVVRKHSNIKQLIAVINGGGIGGAVINSKGEVLSSEPGHLSIIDQSLNPYGIKIPCGFLDRTNTCLEQIGAAGAGIEKQWQILKHEKLTGEEINKLIPADETALNLFANSALVISHITEGLRKVYEFNLENTAVICHGGCFKADGYVDRVKQILQKYYQKPFTLFTTQELGFDNACMTGAAIIASAT